MREQEPMTQTMKISDVKNTLSSLPTQCVTEWGVGRMFRDGKGSSRIRNLALGALPWTPEILKCRARLAYSCQSYSCLESFPWKPEIDRKMADRNIRTLNSQPPTNSALGIC